MRNRARRDPTDLAGQAFDDEQENLANVEIRNNQIGDLKWLMSDKRGRRFMWRLLEKAGIYRPSFTGNSETFFREGERNVGLAFMADITEHTLDEFVLMLKEDKRDL